MNRGKSNRLVMTFIMGLMIFAGGFLYIFNDNRIKEINGEIQQSLNGMVSELNMEIDRYYHIAGLIADNRALFYKQDSFGGGGLSLPDAKKSTMAGLLNEKYIKSICAVDKSGKLYGIVKGKKIEKSLEKEESLFRIIGEGGKEVKVVRKSLFSEDKVLTIMMPVVKTETLSFEGMAGIEVDIVELFNDIQLKNVKFEGQYFMGVSKDMEVLITKDSDKLGKSVKDFKVMNLNTDKISGKAIFFNSTPGLFRIMEFPTTDIKIVSYIPFSAIRSQDIKAILPRVAYIFGVLLAAVSATHIIRVIRKNKSQEKDIKLLREMLSNALSRHEQDE